MITQTTNKLLIIAYGQNSIIAISNILKKARFQGGEVVILFRPEMSIEELKAIYTDTTFLNIIENQAVSITDNIPNITDFINDKKITSVYISLELEQSNELADLTSKLSNTSASVYYIPNLSNINLMNSSQDKLTEVPMIIIRETPYKGYRAFIKRCLDFIISLGIIVIIAPILLLIAIGIKLTSPGPIIFKQKRHGFNNKEILVYKFRTMKVCEEGAKAVQATKNDPRVTKFGSFLRKTSLDELPQFFNVLEGTMSIVGPRPHPINLNYQFGSVVNKFWSRHMGIPGITGLAQINKCRGETATVEDMERRVYYDIKYLKQWSPFLDLKIIFITGMQVLETILLGKKCDEAY